jgi:hypothetical protein
MKKQMEPGLYPSEEPAPLVDDALSATDRSTEQMKNCAHLGPRSPDFRSP